MLQYVGSCISQLEGLKLFFVHISERLENPLLKHLLFSIYCLPWTNLIDYFWKQQKITQKNVLNRKEDVGMTYC